MTLRTILDKLAFHAGGLAIMGKTKDSDIVDQAETQLLHLIEGIIDTSKPVFYVKKPPKTMTYKELTDFYCKARDDLRAEQRQVLKELRGNHDQ